MLKAPGWAQHAVPVLNGWQDPITGELLKSGRHTQAQIDEFHGVTAKVEVSEPKAEVLVEAPTTADDYETMTKVELEEVGREHGIELDRREKKSSLIEQLKNAVK